MTFVLHFDIFFFKNQKLFCILIQTGNPHKYTKRRFRHLVANCDHRETYITESVGNIFICFSGQYKQLFISAGKFLPFRNRLVYVRMLTKSTNVKQLFMLSLYFSKNLSFYWDLLFWTEQNISLLAQVTSVTHEFIDFILIYDKWHAVDSARALSNVKE